MRTQTFTSRLVAFAATLIVSTACIVGAVGPATAGHASPVEMGQRA